MSYQALISQIFLFVRPGPLMNMVTTKRDGFALSTRIVLPNRMRMASLGRTKSAPLDSYQPPKEEREAASAILTHP